MEHSFQMWRR